MSPDKMSRTQSRTKYYEDKMLLVEMSRHFVHDILSTTYCDNMLWTKCRGRNAVDNIIVNGILSATFCP